MKWIENPIAFLFQKTEGGILFIIFIANYFWKKRLVCSRMGSDEIYPVNPWILHVSWNKNLKLPLSWSSLLLKVIVPICSYRLSCSSVFYMNVSVESGKSDREASRCHHHRCFLEPFCKVQLPSGLISFYIIVAELITRTNKNLRSHS